MKTEDEADAIPENMVIDSFTHGCGLCSGRCTMCGDNDLVGRIEMELEKTFESSGESIFGSNAACG